MFRDDVHCRPTRRDFHAPPEGAIIINFPWGGTLARIAFSGDIEWVTSRLTSLIIHL